MNMEVSQDKYQLLYKIAKLYYEDQMSQDEIAKLFNISCATVSRSLSEARRKNVIQIKVVDFLGLSKDLEVKLEKRFNLQRAVVAYVPIQEPLIIKRVIGREAAKYIIEIIKDNQSIGLSWGTTLLEMVEALYPKTCENLSVVELIGNFGRIANQFDISEIAGKFAENFHAIRYILQAPGRVSTAEIKTALLAEYNIMDVVQMGKKVDIAITGIGSFPHSIKTYKSLHFSDKELEDIKLSGAVGDICLRFFDKNGKKCDTAIDDTIVGISLEHFRKVPLRIGIAGGAEKRLPIKAALLGSLINIIITDNYTAEYLIA